MGRMRRRERRVKKGGKGEGKAEEPGESRRKKGDAKRRAKEGREKKTDPLLTDHDQRL